MMVFLAIQKRNVYLPDALELEDDGWEKVPTGDATWRLANPTDVDWWRAHPHYPNLLCHLRTDYVTGQLVLLEHEKKGSYERPAPGTSVFRGWLKDAADFITIQRLAYWAS